MDNCIDHKDCIHTVTELQLLVNTHNEKISQAEVRLQLLCREVWEGENSIISRLKKIEVDMKHYAEVMAITVQQLDKITARVIYGAAIFSVAMPIISGIIIGIMINWLK